MQPPENPLSRLEHYEAHSLPHANVVVHYPSKDTVYVGAGANDYANALNAWLAGKPTGPPVGRIVMIPYTGGSTDLLTIIDRMMEPERMLDALEAELLGQTSS